MRHGVVEYCPPVWRGSVMVELYSIFNGQPLECEVGDCYDKNSVFKRSHWMLCGKSTSRTKNKKMQTFQKANIINQASRECDVSVKADNKDGNMK